MASSEDKVEASRRRVDQIKTINFFLSSFPNFLYTCIFIYREFFWGPAYEVRSQGEDMNSAERWTKACGIPSNDKRAEGNGKLLKRCHRDKTCVARVANFSRLESGLRQGTSLVFQHLP